MNMTETSRTHYRKGKRPLRIEDMRRLKYLSSPVLSPDGSQVAYVLYSSCSETGDFIPRIHMVSSDGSNERLLDFGGSNESHPVFSPDGAFLAFLTDRSGETQIWLQNLANGTLQQVTSMRHGVTAFSWSPDGQQIAFLAPLWPGEEPFGEMDAKQKAQWEHSRSKAPIDIDKIIYKHDETKGVFDGSVKQIGVVSIDTKEVKMLTSGPFQNNVPVWSPDGSTLAFTSNHRAHVEALPSRYDIYIMPSSGGEARHLKVGRELSSPFLQFTPDGASLVYSGLSFSEGKDSAVEHLFLASVVDGSTRCLFPEEEVCHGVGARVVNWTVFGQDNPPFALSRCGRYVYFLSLWDGCCHVYRAAVEGPPTIEKITTGRFCVHAFCPPQSQTLVYSRGDPQHPGDLFSLDLDTGAERRLTMSNDWLNDILLSRPVELKVKTRDDTTMIQGWVYPPLGLEKGKKFPVVLNIHGGPQAAFAEDFWFEPQILAASGMAVVMCNPRGSSGYGMAFCSNRYAWGCEAYDDLIGFMEEAAQQLGFLDLECAGITGGSYGGFMTCKIIGLTKRFAAAVAQRTLVNRGVSYGAGDMGFVSKSAEGLPFPDKREMSQLIHMQNRFRESPITGIDNISTPLLILHGEKDYRCDLQQAEQLFVAMRDRHPEVPVRMVVFKDENHDVTRTGRIHNQMRHLAEMDRWFRRYLMVK